MNNSSNLSCDGEQTAHFQFYLFPITYILVMVFGLPGNLGALYIFIFRTEQKAASRFYIISLAVADTVFLCILPFRIHYHLNGNNWIFGDPLCRLTGTLFFANVYISIGFMSCICVDRYLATVYPHLYLRLRNTRCSVAVSGCVWVLVVVAILAVVFTSPDMHNNDGRISCFENFSENEWKTKLAPYSTFCLIFGALFPSIIILLLYPVVARRIAQIKTRTASSALRIIYTILAIMVLCFLPYHLVYFLHLLWRTQVIHNCFLADGIYKARRVTMALVSLNSLLDPVLYYFATSYFSWNCKWNLKLLKPKKRRGVYVISETMPAQWWNKLYSARFLRFNNGTETNMKRAGLFVWLLQLRSEMKGFWFLKNLWWNLYYAEIMNYIFFFFFLNRRSNSMTFFINTSWHSVSIWIQCFNGLVLGSHLHVFLLHFCSYVTEVAM